MNECINSRTDPAAAQDTPRYKVMYRSTEVMYMTRCTPTR